MNTNTRMQIDAELADLEPEAQERALEFVRKLKQGGSGCHRTDLSAFAGTIPSDELRLIQTAVEAGCEQQLTVDLKNAACTLTPMTAREYVETVANTLPIFEDYDHVLALRNELEWQAPDFDHPRLYAALKHLFGESTTAYDDYKCSFGYPFVVKIVRDGRESRYVMKVTDLKGGINFQFRKILGSAHELEEFPNRAVLRKPMEHDFSSGEMQFLMTWFVFYLVGFMRSFEQYSHEEFARSLDYCCMIYGYRNGEFFRECYDVQEDFCTARLRMLESGDIPFNRVKPNSSHDSPRE